MSEKKQLVDLQFYGVRDKLKNIEEALQENNRKFYEIFGRVKTIEETLLDSNKVANPYKVRAEMKQLIDEAIANHIKQVPHCSVTELPGSASKVDLDKLRMEIEGRVWEHMDHIKELVMRELAENLCISFGNRDRW